MRLTVKLVACFYHANLLWIIQVPDSASSIMLTTVALILHFCVVTGERSSWVPDVTQAHRADPRWEEKTLAEP